MSIFKQQNSFQYRCNESKRVLDKYHERIPIICEQSYHRNYIPSIDKNKYLVPSNFSLAQFMVVIRQRLKLNSDEALFFIIGNSFVSSTVLLSHIYELYKDEDGFLYIQYSKENTFGSIFFY